MKRIKYNRKLVESGEAVYIGRGFRYHHIKKSKWHNPFSLKEYSREESLLKFEKYLKKSGLINEIHELRGKTLCCHCNQDEACHGDILIRYAT